jgi:hypothetical protein
MYCQHLSLLWLTASILSVDAHTMSLAGLHGKNKQLLLLRNAQPTQSLDCSKLQAGCRLALADAPESWQSGQRCPHCRAVSA